jgi:hypothetical protein
LVDVLVQAVYAPYQGTAETNFGSVLSASEPVWSHMHVGLSLFVYRILHKVWEMSLLRVVGSGNMNGAAAAPTSGVAAVELSLPPDTIAALEAIMRGLVVVVNHVLERLQVRSLLAISM